MVIVCKMLLVFDAKLPTHLAGEESVFSLVLASCFCSTPHSFGTPYVGGKAICILPWVKVFFPWNMHHQSGNTTYTTRSHCFVLSIYNQSHCFVFESRYFVFYFTFSFLFFYRLKYTYPIIPFKWFTFKWIFWILM